MVEPTLSADCPEGLDQDSALGVLGSSGDGKRFLRPRNHRLPCPSVPLQSITAAVNRELPCCCCNLLLIPRFSLRGASRSRDIETTVKTATAHPAFRLVRSLLKGAIHRHFRSQSSVPNWFRCRIAELVSSASPSQVAETSRERVTLPSRFRVANVFAPLRRQRASTTAGAAVLATARGRLCAKPAPRGLFPTNRKKTIRSLPRSFSHSLFRRVEPHETRNRSNTVPSLRFVSLRRNQPG